MITYIYECDDGHQSEVRQRISDETLSECPQKACMRPARRVIQPVGHIWKDGPPTPRNLTDRIATGVPDWVPESTRDEEVGQMREEAEQGPTILTEE